MRLLNKENLSNKAKDLSKRRTEKYKEKRL